MENCPVCDLSVCTGNRFDLFRYENTLDCLFITTVDKRKWIILIVIQIIIMRLTLNIIALLFYSISLYFCFIDSNSSLPDFIRIVGGDAYNHNYKFLFSIVLAVMGTGFTVMASSYPSKDYLSD